VALWKREVSLRFWSRALGLISGRLAEKLTALLALFIDGLRALPDLRRIVGVLFLSVAYWGIAVFGTWLMFRAFHLDLPFSAALVLNGILLIGVMVPGAPGFAGPFEMAVKVALVDLFLVSQTECAGFTIVLHGMQFAFTLAVGLIFLFSGHVSLIKIVGDSRKAASNVEKEESPERIAVRPRGAKR
jgi:uncharacterized membrane protein YbhN (UPF0104 family)